MISYWQILGGGLLQYLISIWNKIELLKVVTKLFFGDWAISNTNSKKLVDWLKYVFEKEVDEVVTEEIATTVIWFFSKGIELLKGTCDILSILLGLDTFVLLLITSVISFLEQYSLCFSLSDWLSIVIITKSWVEYKTVLLTT